MLNTPLLPDKRWMSIWIKCTAVLALLNLILALFNASYVPLRDIYLRYTPQVVHLYDPIKGIEPHPQTEQYQETFERLLSQIPDVGLDSPDVQQSLERLQQESNALIEENPFIASGKFSTFAKLQRRITDRLEQDSVKVAFHQFWSPEYLRSQDILSELNFFQTKIIPLLATNYYRKIDDNGQPYDGYWRIDIWFIGFFALEFLALTLIASRRRVGLSWFDAMLRRWYDWFLFIPVWRWLRILPVTVRLHQGKVANIEHILSQMIHEPAIYLSDHISEFVTIRTLNQLQEAVENGDVARGILNPSDYVSVGEANSSQAISDRLLELSIYKVLPQVQPEIKSLLNHSISEALRESAFMELVENVPALGHLPKNVTDQLADYLANATCQTLANAYADELGRERFDELTGQFQTALRQELQDQATLDELQSLISNVLQEVKINYVQRSAQQDPEETIEKVEEVYDHIEQQSSLNSTP